MSAIVRFCLARVSAKSRFGIAIAARMPMIATTMSNSIRVKPFLFIISRLPGGTGTAFRKCVAIHLTHGGDVYFQEVRRNADGYPSAFPPFSVRQTDKKCQSLCVRADRQLHRRLF